MNSLIDMLIRIKNAQATGAAEVILPFSQLKWAVAELLAQNGFLAGVERKKKKLKRAELEHLALQLKYESGAGAIQGIKLVSKPSRRVYAGKRALFPVRSGYGLAVLSTPQGIMTGQQARQTGVGGEVLFEIW